MTLWLNYSIIIFLIAAVFLLVSWRILKGSKSDLNIEKSERMHYSLDSINEFIQSRMTQLTTENLYNLGLSEEDFNRRTKRRQELKEALKNCNTGDYGSKLYIREYIYEILYSEYNFDDETINWAIPFQSPQQMSGREIFDVLMYLQRKKHDANGLGLMIESFGLDQPKNDGGYRISEEEIRAVYKENVRHLLFEDKLRIVSQRIYSQFKGFGVIDDIRDMNIDGVSGGVSGVPKRMESYDDDEVLFDAFGSAKTGLNSVWVMYKGKSIHFDFLDFLYESELRRVVQNIYKYNYPGQLSESRPYIINEMHDGSRVTVMRPKFSESWAFFIRKKYNMKKLEVEQLIVHPNAQIPIEMMKYLMKGNRVTAITGAQGSGKTTLLMGLVGHIHKALNLRVQETSFELNLRSIYPDRNILSFQETDNMSGQDGLDLQKKTDGAVNILGEVATDPVAAWMIQTAQVASLFTLFTHHAKTFQDLVESLRNSLMKAKTFSDEGSAEHQVVNVLEFNVHLRQDYDGSRYIERITECLPTSFASDEITISDAQTRDEKLDVLMTVATNYFKQKTQKNQFKAIDIVKFENGKYIAGDPLSAHSIREIESVLSVEEKEEFRSFIKSVWGDDAA